MLTVHKLTAGDFPSFLEGLSLRRRYPLLPVHLDSRFPFLFGRAFIEAREHLRHDRVPLRFPFLFGRAFIEAPSQEARYDSPQVHFPSFLEGLSLRRTSLNSSVGRLIFPFLFGRAFIEAGTSGFRGGCRGYFPSFLEGLSLRREDMERLAVHDAHFPSFLEGLSLRLLRSESQC